MVDLASNAIALTYQTGVYKKAVAYPTPFDEDLTLEEQYELVNPTIELMDKV